MHAELHTLHLNEAFRIAHGSSTQRQVLRLHHDGCIGEAPLVPYYNDSPTDALAFGSIIRSPDDILPPAAPRAALLALESLRLNLRSRAEGRPLWQSMSLPDPNGTPGCRSFSIPEGIPSFMERVHRAAQQFPMLKLKLGSGDLDFDIMIVHAARHAAPNACLVADVNGGWTPEQAAEILPYMHDQGLLFVEQPISHREGLDAWIDLRSRIDRKVPWIIADESAQTVDDLLALAEVVEGVNIKLLKTRGLLAALTMIYSAKALGMRTLLGCMIETSIGIATAANLAGTVDWIDLDGHLYVANDEAPPWVSYDSQGRLRLRA
jgi:L-Ala-D/L-Glu epimerase